jgi:enterochelin esterase family protein
MKRGSMSLERALLVIVLTAAPALAQPPASPPPSPPPPVISPEVHADRTVTFRLRAPNAKEVSVQRDVGARLAMQKDDQGVWSVTSEPLEPDIYGYSFSVDGVTHFDPSNPAPVPNYLYTASSLHVPGPSLPWEEGDVPRGAVHHHFHHSSVVGDNRDFYVYTPPGYDAKAAKPYPVLYLLHGFSDDARGWTAVGRANVILDNLIASGRARPMLVVMPFGYGAPEILSKTGPQFRDVSLRQRNQRDFRETLLRDVMPMVEKLYRAATDRESRAVAGLSMGGGESLDIGLNARDRFAWVGAFSSAVPDDADAAFPGLDANTKPPLRLLWIACGSEDFLTAANHKFWDWLQARRVPFTKVETPGGHTWPVWRRNLAAFAQLIFK